MMENATVNRCLNARELIRKTVGFYDKFIIWINSRNSVSCVAQKQKTGTGRIPVSVYQLSTYYEYHPNSIDSCRVWGSSLLT